MYDSSTQIEAKLNSENGNFRSPAASGTTEISGTPLTSTSALFTTPPVSTQHAIPTSPSPQIDPSPNTSSDPETVFLQTDCLSNVDSAKSKTDSDIAYPSTIRAVFITIALTLASFPVALDRTIVAPAIPQITNQFQSLSDGSWYGVAFLLTATALQPTWGKIYQNFNIKWTYIFVNMIFFVGSLISAAAPNSIVFILGRSIAGLGTGGIFSGGLTIIAYTVPVSRRAALTGLLGIVFGISMVVGPVLGGAFTSNVSWRWCFYINLPIVAVSVIPVALLVQSQEALQTHKTFLQRVNALDWIGPLFFIPGIVCLLIPLQFNGSKWKWNSPASIGLFIGFGVFMSSWFYTQFRLGERATVPLRLMLQRTIFFSSLFSIMSSGAFVIPLFYLPLYFQAINDSSAMKSGLQVLPLIVTATIASFVGGVLISLIGYVTPIMLSGMSLFMIGAGLITTLTSTTPFARIFGFQILLGVGMGVNFQTPIISVQTVAKLSDVPIVTALVLFYQQLGTALFIAVGQAVLLNKLLHAIQVIDPSITMGQIINAGATGLKNLVSGEESLTRLLSAYARSLDSVFIVATVVAGLSVLFACGVEWKSMKGGEIGAPEDKDEEKQRESLDQGRPIGQT